MHTPVDKSGTRPLLTIAISRQSNANARVEYVVLLTLLR